MSTERPQPASGPHSRPRMRGWLHVYAFVLAIVGGVVMCPWPADTTAGRRSLDARSMP